MDKEKFIEAIKEIGQCEDESERMSMLAKLNDETSAIFDENATLKTINEKYESDNEKLRKTNMDLFLQVGSTKSDDERKKDTTGLEDEEKKKRKFEDLFDEKGGIK